MPSRRADVEMSPDEIRDYLRSHFRLTIVSNGLGGYPHPMPMNYAIDGEDRIVMTTFKKSQKVANLRRDPRATLLVETGVAYNELKSVIAYANAEIVEEPEIIFEVIQMLSKNPAGQPAENPEVIAQMRATLPKRVILRFQPARYLSWDHSKLKGRY
jgi:nitroimidazol reductase NimA-like FMN-containing flavoprotein (pyridoxamine 5'-phosphate oxidase superfamily)